MLKLQRPNRPEAFTPEIELNLTTEYLATNSAVWHRAPGVVEALRSMSRDKCAYCESSIADRNTPSEIDHFANKDDYPDLVVKWVNLLPCCRGCNSRKGTHDVCEEPIVNPCDINPKEHLRFTDCYFRHKTPLGKSTLRVLDFNVDRNLMKALYVVTLQANNRLSEIVDRATAIPPPVKGNLTRIRTRMITLMKDGQAQEYFAAAISTTILKSPDYATIKAFLQAVGKWDDELSQIESELEINALI